jgi:hypothetical protein
MLVVKLKLVTLTLKLLALREPDLTNFSVFVYFNIADFKSNVTSFY